LRVAVVVTPVVVGFVTYRCMNAYKLSGAERFTKVPLAYFMHPRKAPVAKRASGV
jgi:hypothetical protein